VIATVVTGASCGDPTGDCAKVNSFKKSSLESWQGPRVGWPLTAPEVHGTQVGRMACNDHRGVLYWSGVIVVALVEDQGR
jgi:hypothetical protein